MRRRSQLVLIKRKPLSVSITPFYRIFFVTSALGLIFRSGSPLYEGAFFKLFLMVG